MTPSGPAATVAPGRTRTKPPPDGAMPLTALPAPLLTGTGAWLQVTPPSRLRHRPIEVFCCRCFFPPAPVRAVVVTCAVTTVSPAWAAAPTIAPTVPLTVPPGGPSGSRAAARCQARPSGEVHTTGTADPCWAADPAARNPRAVAVSASTRSPGSSGMPGVAVSCQDRPVPLVQDAPGLMASQPAGPATIAVGGWGSGGSLPFAVSAGA